MYIYIIYTERQKKRVTSSERRSQKSTKLKLIILVRRIAKVLLMKHISKIKACFCQKGEILFEIAKGRFSNITETAH